MNYDACPNCGHNHKASFFSGSHFEIYECTACDSKYCYECRGSNGARKCPECGSSASRTVGRVYLR